MTDAASASRVTALLVHCLCFAVTCDAALLDKTEVYDALTQVDFTGNIRASAHVGKNVGAGRKESGAIKETTQ